MPAQPPTAASDTPPALFCLDASYATTRLVTHEAPVIEDPPDAAFKSTLFLPPNPDRTGEGGLRTKGYFKRSLPDKPLITVITVVFNGAQHLEDTIKSVINQTYDNVEYIIIDGGSTDGTLDIIKQYEGQIDYWVSEKDKGIYDAMNKGTEVANGEWAIYMNSGDAFHCESVLDNVIYLSSTDDDVIYGQYVVKYFDGSVRKAIPNNLESVWKGTVTSHQAMLIRTDLIKIYRFDQSFELAADHELFAKLHHLGYRFHYVSKIISAISASGVSDIRRSDVFREFAKVAMRYYPLKPFRIYFFIRILDNFVRFFAKKILPKRIVLYIQAK